MEAPAVYHAPGQADGWSGEQDQVQTSKTCTPEQKTDSGGINSGTVTQLCLRERGKEVCKMLGREGCLTAPGLGRGAQQIALALNCILSVSESSASRKRPLRHHRVRRPCPGHQQSWAAAAKHERNSTQINLTTQEFASTRPRKLFYFVTYVGFGLYTFELFLL